MSGILYIQDTRKLLCESEKERISGFFPGAEKTREIFDYSSSQVFLENDVSFVSTMLQAAARLSKEELPFVVENLAGKVDA